jgi:branched-chain amino acid transport system substrate-binding protein
MKPLFAPRLARPRRRLAAFLAAASLCIAGGARADITLAGVTEARGAGAAAGTSFRNGYQLAVEQINAAGGVLGQPLRVQQFDIDTREQAARDAVSQAVALKPFAVLGPVFSGLTMASMPITAAGHVPHFTGGEAASLTRQFHPSLLRTSLTQQESLPRLCGFAVYGLGARKLGVLWLDNEFGRGGRTVLEGAARRRGASVVYEDKVVPSQKDWNAILDRLSASGVDALILLLTEDEAASALAALRARNFALPVLGDGPMVSTRVVTDPRNIAEGLIGHSGNSTDLPTPRMARFVADYEHRFGTRPDHNSLKGWFAVQALRIGLEAVGRADQAAVLDYLKDSRLDGRRQPDLMTSWVRYDLFGDLNRESYVLQAHGGKMRLVATLSPLDPSFALLPNGRSVAIDSDEFRRSVRTLLSGGELASAEPRAGVRH